MSKTRKLLALVLALVMCLGLFAGCTPSNGDATPTPTQNPGQSQDPSQSQNPGTDVTPTYTYNGSLSVFPTGWNYHTYQTDTASTILSLLSDAFYTFDYNDTMDGYQMVPSMVVGDPVDVTADYIGQYGLEEGAKNRAWKYTLKDDLKWDDGTPIHAVDFAESAKRLLNPVAQNYRADGLYASSFVLHNAERYLKQGTYFYSNMISSAMGDDEYTALADFKTNENGQYVVEGKGDVWLKLDSGGNWGQNSLEDYYNAGYTFLFTKDDVDLWQTVLLPAANEDKYVPVTEEVAKILCDAVAGLHDCANAEEYAKSAGDYAYIEWEEFCWYGADAPEMDFSEVGIFALSDTELVLVLDQELSGFYLKYYIGGDWLVKTDLYDSCEKVVDGVYSNTYGTSVETTASFGPYKLTGFQMDKQFAFEKNENWHGFKDGQYQTTNVVYDYVPEAGTGLELFLSGKLDTYGLSSEDMATYQLSDYTYYSTSSGGFGMVFNPGLSQLEEKQKAAGENINKTILTVKEFRMAMSFALDRNAFALAVAPTNKPGFALYSDLIVCDPEAGTTYRSTPQAKQALAEFWGVADDVGDGKLYATIDDAIESVTGYNLELAKSLFSQAYDIAIEQGLMDSDDVIQLCIGLPGTRPFYVNGSEFLINNYTEAVKGTKLEGKLTFTTDNTIADDFSGALKRNQVDLLFGVGWTGSALDPYNLWQVYVMPNYVYDANVDYSKLDVEVTLTDGVTYTADAITWCDIMSGKTGTITAADGTTKEFSCGIADNDPENRLNILAASEGAVLQQYDYLPMLDDSSAQLKSMQITFGTEEYIFGMGFGGLQYYTYNYSDQEWDAYVAKQGGTLDYT